jgi:xanthine dehydrogenase accessory factor
MAKELSKAAEWLTSCNQIVLAIVSKTWGSAPRRAGSMMVVHPDGVFEGSVSGGCVEGSIIAESLALMSGQTVFKILTFSVASEQAWEVGLACGGEIEIKLFVLTAEHSKTLDTAQHAIATRQSAVLSFIEASSYHLDLNIEYRPLLPTQPETQDSIFQVPIQPSLRLEIVGAVHIAQHLAAIAQECEFEVRIIDPRGAFTESRDFVGVKPISEWPDDYFKQNPPDGSTAIVTLTHDPKLDDAALMEILESPAFYIGCLGGRKTHNARLKRLMSAGMNENELLRIHGPVGLPIGAANPAEIAVSIMADIIQAARQAS